MNFIILILMKDIFTNRWWMNNIFREIIQCMDVCVSRTLCAASECDKASVAHIFDFLGDSDTPRYKHARMWRNRHASQGGVGSTDRVAEEVRLGLVSGRGGKKFIRNGFLPETLRYRFTINIFCYIFLSPIFMIIFFIEFIFKNRNLYF